jgi:hypothetical protein
MTIPRLLASLACLAASHAALATGPRVDLTLYDRTMRGLLPAHQAADATYVAGAPGNEYSIRLRNRSDGDVLAVVSVDGVNVVTGETASPSQRGYVISANGELEIKGWRKSLERIAAFYFTDLGDSYAARTGRPDDLGVIGVAVFERKPESRVHFGRDAMESPKQAEREARAAPSSPAAKLGTGHGRRESSQARVVAFERATSAPAEIVTLRYDSRANLIAMGVIEDTRRPPDPFPAAFVPDPR